MYKLKHQKMMTYYLLVLGMVGLAVFYFRTVPTPEAAVALAAEESRHPASSLQPSDEPLPVTENIVALNQEVQSLVSKQRQEVVQGEGWIHVVELHQRNKQTAGSLSIGQQIPLNYNFDTWYHLNEQGNVIEMVNLMKDGNGKVIQASTYSKGVWENLTVGEKWQGEPPMLNLDYGFSNDVANASSWGSVLGREENSLPDGKTTLIFTIRDAFDQPVKFEGYEKLVVSGETRAYFDQQSGALLSLNRIFVDENGNEFFAEQMTILVIEKSDLPSTDVLVYLERNAK
jgi:hypothetical protein